MMYIKRKNQTTKEVTYYRSKKELFQEVWMTNPGYVSPKESVDRLLEILDNGSKRISRKEAVRLIKEEGFVDKTPLRELSYLSL